MAFFFFKENAALKKSEKYVWGRGKRKTKMPKEPNRGTE